MYLHQSNNLTSYENVQLVHSHITDKVIALVKIHQTPPILTFL